MTDYLGLLAWGAEGWGDQLAQGTWLTIRLALATLPFGLVLGFLVALARNAPTSLVLRPLGDAFTTVFRGLPELLTLFIVYYGGQMLFQRVAGLFTDTYVELSGFVAGMIALGFVFAAFASEVFLGALRAIPRGQHEAAKALGLSRFNALRFIIFPQLWRYALPGIANLWLVLLKDTALVSVIALNDLLRMTNVVVGATREPFFFYFVACMIYLTLSLVSSLGIIGVERWAARGERRPA
jgi:polar amino acid transport system permease protein